MTAKKLITRGRDRAFEIGQHVIRGRISDCFDGDVKQGIQEISAALEWPDKKLRDLICYPDDNYSLEDYCIFLCAIEHFEKLKNETKTHGI